ncbi:ribonuclease toxin immunity protein CdiI [Paenibacillus sp. JJ-100]|uniref:ribonuclease toxin immunity protein CdiI n=1 Tax=Paenibacillus sp. JJ-100 TaxID=2974896 RepID=UPI00232D06A0|nr:ribonuclease toxin immunity protein CdiI [Paenibacillus sp. JJ-100]
MSNYTEERQMLRNSFKYHKLEKSYITTVLVQFVFDYDFIEILKGFLNEYLLRRDTIGVVYSDEFEVGDEGYFGENKVLFYYGIDDDWYDIVTYDELCNYLQVACDFFIERNKEKAEEANKYLIQIKEKYGVE